MGSTTIRVAGVCGILGAAALVPALVVGSPEKLTDSDGVLGYFGSMTGFVTANGTLPLLHVLLTLLFFGVLTAMLRSATGPTGAAYTAVIGSAVYLTLTAAGLAAEVAIPATVVHFDVILFTSAAHPFLVLATWLYHYAQIGAAAVIFATAYIVVRTGVLPKWAAALAVLGVLPLLHTWVGVPAAYCTLAWLALTGLVMLILPPIVRIERSIVGPAD